MSAACARLAVTAVDAELGLHLPGLAVRVAVVPERRALAGDSETERATDAADEGRELVVGQRVRRAKWMKPCPPQRLVRVDVPDPREDALVGAAPFRRRAARGGPLGQRARGEPGAQGLFAEPLCEVRLELARLEEKPRPEAADVSVCNVRSVA